MLLYHVSPKWNRRSIEIAGIDPLWSKGARRVCWWVSRDRLMWALAHCSGRHGVSVRDLDVWTLLEAHKPSTWQKTAHRGIFNTPCRVMADGFESAKYYIENEEKRNTS